MAKAADVKTQQKGPVKKVKSTTVKWEFPLNKKNGMYLAISLGVILVGYIFMAFGITNEPAHEVAKWNNTVCLFQASNRPYLPNCFQIFGIICPNTSIKRDRSVYLGRDTNEFWKSTH